MEDKPELHEVEMANDCTGGGKISENCLFVEYFFGQNQTKKECFKNSIRVKPGFKSVPPQFYFEIVGLASAKRVFHKLRYAFFNGF